MLIDLPEETKVNQCGNECSWDLTPSSTECTTFLEKKNDHLSITYSHCTLRATFGENSYFNLNEIRIYRPSLHKWKGKQTLGEMIIMFGNTSESGNVRLYVSIPLVENSATVQWLKLVLENENKNKNLQSFPPLQSIIPKTQNYYSYQGSGASLEDNVTVEYIVYPLSHGIHVSKNDFDRSLTPSERRGGGRILNAGNCSFHNNYLYASDKTGPISLSCSDKIDKSSQNEEGASSSFKDEKETSGGLKGNFENAEKVGIIGVTFFGILVLNVSLKMFSKWIEDTFKSSY